MPGPILPAVVAGGLTAVRGARSLYKAGKAAAPVIRKEIKDFNKDAPGLLPTGVIGTAITQTDELTGRKMSDAVSKIPKKIIRGSQSQLLNFKRQLIK